MSSTLVISDIEVISYLFALVGGVWLILTN